jgi:hypothetical protein
MSTVRTGERRRFCRLNDHIFVLCRLIEKENVHTVKAFTKNIGEGGLCFETEQFIPVRTVLDLEVYQPLRKPEGIILSIPAQAKVKWVISTDTATRYEGANKYRSGVEFVKIGDREKKEIAGYVKDAMKQ